MTKYITPNLEEESMGGEGAVESVNGQDGIVTLDADDVSDSGTTNKYATSANIGIIATSVLAKTTPVDADTIPLSDSEASNALKKISWFNIKATLKSYLDVLYQPLASVLTNTTASFTTSLETKLNGVESNADVTDSTNVDSAGATMNSDTTLASNGYFLDEDSFTSDSATKVASQQSTKAYVDAQIIGSGSGDVVGPASSVDNEVVLFNSTTGKLVKRASSTGIAKLTSGVLSAVTAPSGTIVGDTDSITLTNKTIVGANNTITGIDPTMRTGGFKIGTILGASVLNTTGNKGITGVGFTPKLVRFSIISGASTAASTSAYGAMTASEQYYQAHSGSTTATARNGDATHCMGWVPTTSSTPSLLCTYVSMDADGFTINVGTASSTFNVQYEAYG